MIVPSVAFNAAIDQAWDAVVIGAGPAGAVAARQLALDGKSVLLVDKARFPRDKVCGGCLGGAALDVLESIGLGHVPAACGAVPLHTFALASDGVTARIPIGRRAAISRRMLDAALVAEAAHAGVIVCDRTLAEVAQESRESFRRIRLKTEASEQTVHARVAIIATGLAQCPPGHEILVSPGSRIGLGAVLDEPPCEVSPGVLHMACTSKGYVGVTSVENGHYDIAAAIDPSALAAADSPGDFVHRILDEAGFAPTIDLGATKWHGTPPLTRRAVPLASHRCLLIGDAAGYIEPFTGEGIGWAMSSAMLAASLLAGSRGAWPDDVAVRWERTHCNALHSHQRSCLILSQLLRVNPLRRIAMWSLRRAPAVSAPVVCRLDRPIPTL